MKNQGREETTIYTDPQYQGKHVIQAGDEVFVAKTEKKIVSILQKLRKEQPDVEPVVEYIPKSPHMTV